MTREDLEEGYKLRGTLTLKKIMKYLPFMLMTNLSNLLLISVDGLVVGNFVGAKALAAINIFSPIVILIGIFSDYIAASISTYLSVCMGKNDTKKVQMVKRCSIILTVWATILITFIQLPIVYILINSYNVSQEMVNLTWKYAIGILISMPCGMISTIGVCQLQIVGRMKALMGLAVIEGLTNLVLDLIFVRGLDLGIAGAGYGTALANVVRASLTILYLYKKTDVYKTGEVKAKLEEVKKILKSGLPEFANSAMMAFQNYIIVKIIIDVFGEDGGIIRGVCTFALSLILVAVNGIQGSSRPLVGLLTGSKGWKALRILVRQSMLIMTTIVGGISILILLFPQGLYYIHGVNQIPEYGIASLRIYSLYFIIRGYNAIFRLYFSNRRLSNYSSSITIIGSLAMPVFAFIISRGNEPEWIWISYFLAELIIFVTNCFKYKKVIKEDEKNEKQKGLIYMTIMPDEAIEASRAIRKYANSNGIKNKLSYKISLCMEEMVAYSKNSNRGKNVNIQIVVRFYTDKAIFLMIDDGDCIALNEDTYSKELMTDNYSILKKICKSYDYSNILDLNYTIFSF